MARCTTRRRWMRGRPARWWPPCATWVRRCRCCASPGRRWPALACRPGSDPWGGDEIGSLIGELYGLIHDMALTCFESNGEVLGEYADGLHVMADGLDQTETDIAGGLQQIHQALGG